MNPRHRLYQLLIAAAYLIAPVSLAAEMSPEDDAFAFFNIESGLPDISDELVKDNCTDITPFIVVDALTSESAGILIQDLLELQFYKSTAPVVVRSLFDNPNLRSRRINEQCDGQNQLSMKLFFNQMRKAYLTKCSPYINSYIAIDDPEITEELDRLSNVLKDMQLIPQAIDIPMILPLFGKIKLEERRAGGMFTYQRRDDCVEWRLQVPVYYFEHNFFLTESEREAIANAPLFKELGLSGDASSGASSGADVEEFLTEHVVNDIFGIGDLRAQCLIDVIEGDNYVLALGGELDLPTALVLARGIIGKSFPSCPGQPPFDYVGLMCLAQTNPYAAQQLGTQFGVGALDRLTEVAGLAHLGSQHVGLGMISEFNFSFDETLTWRNFFRLFYSFPGNEKRFFRTIKNPADFNRDYTSQALAQENERFLSEQSVLFLYPPLAIAKVRPGIITEFTSSLFLERGCTKAELGYDIWYQGSESLRIINSFGVPYPLDACSGTRHSATQYKVFAFVSVDRNDGCYDWRLGFFGDATFANQGIGKDWTLGIDLRTLF